MDYMANEDKIYLDYVKSDDPAEIDRGMRETVKGVRFSILTMGLGLARIKSEDSFKKLKFRSMSAYVNRFCEDTKMDRSSIYGWLGIGEAYIKYRSELEMIGFSDSNGPSKLPYLERALAVSHKDEVFKNLMNMTQQDFIDFSKGETAGAASDAPYIINKGSVVYIKGKRAIIINKNLGKKTSNFLMKVVEAACKALEKGGYIMPVVLRNKREVERFKKAYSRIMAEVRKG